MTSLNIRGPTRMTNGIIMISAASAQQQVGTFSLFSTTSKLLELNEVYMYQMLNVCMFSLTILLNHISSGCHKSHTLSIFCLSPCSSPSAANAVHIVASVTVTVVVIISVDVSIDVSVGVRVVTVSVAGNDSTPTCCVSRLQERVDVVIRKDTVTCEERTTIR